MRFAWLRDKAVSAPAIAMSPASRLLFVAYNVVWWVPVVSAVGGIVSYRTGFLLFLAITIFRAAANLYRNNILPVEAAQRFPLRSP